MWGSSLRFEHVLCSVFVSVLAVVTCSVHAQQLLPAIRSASQLPDAPSAVARVLGSQKNLNVSDMRSALRLISGTVQSACWMDACRNRIQNTLVLNDHVTQYANSRIARALLTFAPNGSIWPSSLRRGARKKSAIVTSNTAQNSTRSLLSLALANTHASN